MVKKRKRRRFARRSTPFPVSVGANIDGLLESWGGNRISATLATLWENWDKAVGEPYNELATPLGHKGEMLFLGAADALDAQELTLSSCEILERINAFIGSAYFSKTRVSLLGGRTAPVSASRRHSPAPKKNTDENVSAGPDGKYLEEMDMNSPVARCYAKFAKFSQSQSQV